jgi:uncharacterized protein
MFIDINKIDAEGESLEHELGLGDLDDGGGKTMSATVAKLTGRVYKASDGVVVEAHLDADVRRVCGRCLEEFELPVSIDFNLVLVPALPSGANRSDVDGSSDGELFHAPDGQADLDLMAAEQIYLAMPMKPVCRKACRGLCPVCGLNRNAARQCGCDDVVSDDPRLASLRELKNRMTQSPDGLRGEH